MMYDINYIFIFLWLTDITEEPQVAQYTFSNSVLSSFA